MIKVIKKIYKSSFVQSTFNMIVIASCILLGGFIAIYENKSNAKIVANEYFQCYLRNDFKKMYEYVDVDEDEFINLESFKNKLKNEKKQVAFTDYTVSKAKKDGKERIVTVSYVNGYNDKKEEYIIKLKKQSFAGLFPKWKVIIDDQIVKNGVVSVPNGEELTFDGHVLKPSETVTKTNDDGTESKVDVYKFDRLFAGLHEFYTKSEFTEMSCKKRIKKDNADINLKDGFRTLKKEYRESVEKDINEMVVSFFNAEKDKEKYTVLKPFFEDSADENLKKEYKKIKKILFQKDVESDIDSSLYQIDSFDLSDIKVYARNYSSKGSIDIIARCSFSFEAKSDSSGDNTYYSSYVSSYSGDYDVDFNLVTNYNKDSKKFIIKDINLTVKDKEASGE